MIYNIYTDGSSTKEQSGFGFVVVQFNDLICVNGTIIHMASQILPSTITNQQAELFGAIIGYCWVKNNIDDPFCVNICSDSAYLINCYKQQWYKKWKNNGWINSKGENVANRPLWNALLPIFNDPIIDFIKVKGHTGEKYNEIADALATNQLDKAKKLCYNMNVKEKEKRS